MHKLLKQTKPRLQKNNVKSFFFYLHNLFEVSLLQKSAFLLSIRITISASDSHAGLEREGRLHRGCKSQSHKIKKKKLNRGHHTCTEEAVNKLSPISGGSRSQKGTDTVLKVPNFFNQCSFSLSRCGINLKGLKGCFGQKSKLLTNTFHHQVSACVKE